jgi:hypothetical protein
MIHFEKFVADDMCIGSGHLKHYAHLGQETLAYQLDNLKKQNLQ